MTVDYRPEDTVKRVIATQGLEKTKKGAETNMPAPGMAGLLTDPRPLFL